MSTIDLLFIASNFEERSADLYTQKYLCRSEFLEVIVRIADEKYVKSHICRTLPEALGHLINENMLKNSPFVIEGQSFRDEQLWVMTIDDLFYANNANIRTIFNVSFKESNIFSPLLPDL